MEKSAEVAARNGCRLMILTIIDNKVTVKVMDGTEIPPSTKSLRSGDALGYIFGICPFHFSHFVGA